MNVLRGGMLVVSGEGGSDSVRVVAVGGRGFSEGGEKWCSVATAASV